MKEPRWEMAGIELDRSAERDERSVAAEERERETISRCFFFFFCLEVTSCVLPSGSPRVMVKTQLAGLLLFPNSKSPPA